MLRRYARAALCCTLFFAGTAEAGRIETLTQNEFTTAESLDAGMTQAGVHLTLGERYQSYYPAFRFGLGGMLEVGAKLGLTTAGTSRDDTVAGLAGADLKLQLVKQTEGIPVDMAVDLGFDTHVLRSRNVSELTFSTIFSRSYPLTERGYKLSPYGGIELSFLSGSYLDNHETDYYVFGGLEWKFTQKSMLYVELKVGDNDLGGFGIRFEY